ncbi:MAG TPA: DUF6178 family protein [Vicinamibacterales bacterium]
MAKRVRRDRQQANALSDIAIPSKDTVPANHTLTVREDRDERSLLARILDTPQLALAVPRLAPELLHRVIETCGLEDCSDLVALATPAQLQRVFDIDLWRQSRPGVDEELDAARFATWLEVLMQSGATTAAAKVAGMDADLVIAALAQHLRVFDVAAVTPLSSDDGDELMERRFGDEPTCELGGYLLEARRSDAWDTIVDLLATLDDNHPDYFHRVMRGCRHLSNKGFELDGLHDLLDDRAQDLFDLALDREHRREERGFVTPAQARAFLHDARRVPLNQLTPPASNPIVRAYFRGISATPPPDPGSAAVNVNGLLPEASGSPDTAEDTEAAVGAVVELLRDAGVLNDQPRALLPAAPDEPQMLARIQAHMQFANDIDPSARATRMEELVFLANTLVAGCSLRERPFTEREASEAAMAVCNLGLENWPDHWSTQPPQHLSANDGSIGLPENFLVDHDLISVFQIGWTILHRDVSTYAADQLIDVLGEVRCGDRETHFALNDLRLELIKHLQTGKPWAARNALDVIAILDTPAWAALLGLLDECPVLHAVLVASVNAGPRSVGAADFTFISENSQIATIRRFMRSLPDQLMG